MKLNHLTLGVLFAGLSFGLSASAAEPKRANLCYAPSQSFIEQGLGTRIEAFKCEDDTLKVGYYQYEPKGKKVGATLDVGGGVFFTNADCALLHKKLHYCKQQNVNCGLFDNEVRVLSQPCGYEGNIVGEIVKVGATLQVPGKDTAGSTAVQDIEAKASTGSNIPDFDETLAQQQRPEESKSWFGSFIDSLDFAGAHKEENKKRKQGGSGVNP